MALYRRKLTRRKLTRRRRPMRMLKAVRPYKKITNQVHRYIRWADKDQSFPDSGTSPAVIVETGTNQNFSYSFKLRNVVNSVDFTSLYDMYRINKVTIFIERSGSFSNVNLGPLNRYFRIVHDYNDNNLLVSEDDYLEYSNCKTYAASGMRPIKVVLYPKIANKIEDQAGATAFTAMSSNKVWINTVDDNVPHFGVKLFVPAGIASSGQEIARIRVKFDLSFKNSK